MPRKDRQKKARRLRAIQAEADERALSRTVSATSIVQLRLFHGLVPAVASLVWAESLLAALKEAGAFRDPFTELLPHLQELTASTHRVISRQAAELGYPLGEEVARFEAAGTGLQTMARIHQALDSLDVKDARWDQWAWSLEKEEDDDD